MTARREEIAARNPHSFFAYIDPREGEKWFRPCCHGEPTTSLPGSQERIATYIRRLEEGHHLFHPEDENGNESIDDDLMEIFRKVNGRRSRHYG
jgi:hypothetical protein